MISPRIASRFASLLLLAGAACVAPPAAEDYLAVGFRSPEQAFRSFQTAMAGDQLDLEYRCLGRQFRLENGIDGMTYRLGREELFKANPFIKLVTKGQITASERLDASHHVLTVRVKNWFADESFRVLLEREDFMEAWHEEQSLFFDFASFDDHVVTDEDTPGLLYSIARMPPGMDPSQLTELNFGREWRISGFEALVESRPPPSPAP